MLVSTIENFLNRNLPRSPRARELCAALAGRRLAVEVRGTRAIHVRCDGARLLIDRSGAEADVRVIGSPVALLAYARHDANRAWEPTVEVSGDPQVAAQFGELARLLKPDVEEELALAIGDVPAHEIARGVRAALSWSGHAAQTTLRNIAEYLAYERGALVSRPEAREFEKRVAALHDHLEHLEARLDALAHRSAAARPEPRDS